MKQRILFFLKFYALIYAIFAVMKIVFMLYNSDESHFDAGDVLSVIIHGTPLDLSTAGYTCIVPWALCVASIWFKSDWPRHAFRIYSWILAATMAIFLVSDTALYHFWQYKIDATILGYLDQPTNILANISTTYVIVGLAVIAALTCLIAWSCYALSRRQFAPCHRRWLTTGVFLLLWGASFLLVRGGVGKSTMNVGYVYYSNNQFLNHSAVNPLFNFASSSLKFEDFDDLYRYFPDEECDQRFAQLRYSTQSIGIDSLLTTQQPNIVLVLMEGMGATFIEALGGNPGVTPCFNKLCTQGVIFTQCYANSYRTDRGTVCTLSGYPAFPELSVMKMPEKSRSLPSIANSLAQNGYQTSFIYGGDINFTNTNSFLISSGYTSIISDEDFPAEVQHTHSWGVTDHIVLDTLAQHIMRHTPDQPYFITCLTLASHEDWQVPYHRIANNPKANAMAYLDHCIGQLTDRLKLSPAWDNLLLIFIPDHGISNPPGNTESDIERYHIPMLWTGGAVRQPRSISTICNQTDLAATLFGQLGIDHSAFNFSRDVLSQTYTYPCAVHTFSNGISFIDGTGTTIQDLTSRKILIDTPKPSTQRLNHAHAYLQTAIDDFAKR